MVVMQNAAGPGQAFQAGRPHKTTDQKLQVTPPGLFLMVAILFVTSAWGPNPFLFALTLASLVIGTLVTWRPGEPATLLYCFGFQWLQASAAVFSANWQGVAIAEVAERGGDMASATVLTHIALLVLYSSVRLAAGKARGDLGEAARRQAQLVSLKGVAMLYLLSSFAAVVFQLIGRLSPGLVQPMLGLADLKLAAVLIVIYVGAIRGGGFRRLAIAVFAIEFILSIGGYFATFQTIFVLVFVSLVAAGRRMSRMRMLQLGAIVSLAFVLGAIWSYVKIDYRHYVSGGYGQQTVAVGWQDRISVLAEMVFSIEQDEFNEGVDRLVRRVMYVEFFGGTLEHVPEVVPHTGGEMWTAALLHPVTPRILFPNKPILDDSDLTRKYSGFWVAGREEGTSISIGYIGQTYIDFGALGLVFVFGMFGIVMGWLYKYITRLPRLYGLASMCLAFPVFYAFGSMTISLEKMVGSTAASAIAVLIVHKFLGNQISRLMYARPTSAGSPAEGSPLAPREVV